MSERRIGNVVALSLIWGLQFVTGAAIQIVLARFLGKEGFGVVGFVSTVAAMLAWLVHMNFPVLLSREVARRRDEAWQLVSSALLAVSLTSSLALVGIVSYAWLADGRPVVVISAALAGIAQMLVGAGMVVGSAFDGLRQQVYKIPGTVAARVSMLVVTLALLWAGAGIVGVFAAQLVSMALALVVVSGMLAWKLEGRPAIPRPSAAVQMVRRGLPFGFDALFASIYLASDVLIVKMFFDDAEVGLYRSAATMYLILAGLPAILNGSVYPILSTLGADKLKAAEYLAFYLRVLLVVGVALGVGGASVAEDLLALVMGEEYRPAGTVFLVLLLALPLNYVKSVMSVSLSAFDAQNERTFAAMLAAGVNVAANLALVPVLGASGAALTTLGTEALLTAYTAWRVQVRVHRLRFAGTALRVAVTASAMLGVVFAAGGLPVLVRVGLGGLTYLVVGYLVRAWRPADLRALKGL